MRIVFSAAAIVVAGLAARSLSEPVQQSAASAAIKVDQVGYLADAAKTAFVVSQQGVTKFTVRRADGGVEFTGTAGAQIADLDSGDRVQALDFSGVRREGTYYLDVPGAGRSWPFAIGNDIYRRAYYLTLRSFYGQRCGTAVDLGPEFPGYRHDICHTKGAYHASSGRSGDAPSRGGWHDAGDYGRYVVNSGITTGTLLWTWELFGDRIRGISLDIPESANRTPDILDEIRWNLDWMLSMQDADGGAWHKQTSERFAPFVMPEADTSISYVVGTGAAPFKSTCATADLAAVAAIAARAYAPFDAEYAARARAVAERAWTWTEAHPNVVFRNPPGVVTGEYGDLECGDERLWAAAELWRTTKGEKYTAYFTAHYAAYLDRVRAVSPQSWASVAPLALWTYALGGGPDAEAGKKIAERTTAAADAIANRTQASPYRHSLVTTDYVWGSNAVVANYAMQLLVANRLRANERYVAAALDNVHYLLGRNPFSLSWVTQLGANPYRRPHHRPSGADANAEPWPGLLSGGPNRRKQDPAMQKLADLPAARMYLDDQESYASNEIAINWNAPAVFVFAGLPR
jgi:endoglucanase